jgi:hypothetical protein
MAASPDYKVHSFALAIPRLNDIFIRVAGGENNHDNHQNHKEASRESAKNMANR